MSPISFADFLRALAIKVVLDRLGTSKPAVAPGATPRRATKRGLPAGGGSASAPRAAREGASAPGSAARSEAGGAPSPAGGETPARPRRAVPALALLGVGAILMLVFESPVTRVIGVLALFAFVVSGVFALADPRWLGSAPELGQRDASRTGASG